MTGPSFDEVTRIRGLAFEKAAVGNFGVEPAQWFKVATVWINALKDVEDGVAEEMSALSKRLEDAARGSLYRALFSIIGIWVITLITVFSVIRSTSGSLAKLAESMEDIATGEADLTRRIHLDARDELGRVAVAYNLLAEKLTTFVGRIQDSSGIIAETAATISQGNRGLSSRTEQQAAGLEETAASLEELASTLKHTATAAAGSNEQARNARELTQAGSELVAQVVKAMDEVRKDSARIAEINSLVDEIAFQTNLLALNAAVEAARAGELGRGFAVVAAEVRILAGRSSEASKEIRILVQAGAKRAQQGTDLASQAGTTMGEVLASVEKVCGLVSEIATSTREQSLGLDQVYKAVSQMDTATQQNAALVAAADESSSSLDEEAQSLYDQVSHFRIR